MKSSSTKPIRRRRDYGRELRIGALVAVVGGAIVGAVIWFRHPRAAPPVVAATPPPPVVVVDAAPAPAPVVEADSLVRATISAPDSIPFGSPLTAHWTGPDNPADFVTFVKSGTPPATYGLRRLTKDGWKLSFPAPQESGPWELRYVAGRAKKILGRSTVVVRPRTAELAAPDQAILGMTVSVSWTAMSRPGDCLTIVSRDTTDGTFETVTNVEGASPVDMEVPLDPGDAEIRYMTKDHQVIGRRPLMITIPITTLFAPDEVMAGAKFEVRWNGPNRPTDQIRLVPLSSATTTPPYSAPTANGSPIRLQAPSTSGRAELRYVVGPKALILARRPIRILPLH